MIPLILKPLLASGLSLLSNAVMAKGKEWLQEKTGVDIDKASLSPEDLANLRQFEMDHEEELLRIKQEDNKLEAAVEMAYLADVGNARDLQIAALKQNDVFSKRFLYFFTIGWSLFVGIYIVGITFGNIPEKNIRFADTILGVLLGTVLAGMFGFFYGSSQSSKSKDETLKAVMERPK